jgi:hypothetical protein
MTMTWEFFDKYCDEAYAIISPDWFNSELVSPVGFKFDELKKDLAAIKKAEAAPAPH